MSTAAVLPSGVSLREWRRQWVYDDSVRELVGGTLVLAPSERAVNLRAASRITRLVEDTDSSVEGLQGLGVVIEGDPAPTVRRPDVVFVRADLGVTDYQVSAGDVVMAVEVVSPSTVRIDEGAKVHEYAKVGINLYLLVDVRNPGSASLTLFSDPADGEYRARTHGSRVDLPLGSGVILDVAKLQLTAGPSGAEPSRTALRAVSRSRGQSELPTDGFPG